MQHKTAGLNLRMLLRKGTGTKYADGPQNVSNMEPKYPHAWLTPIHSSRIAQCEVRESPTDVTPGGMRTRPVKDTTDLRTRAKGSASQLGLPPTQADDGAYSPAIAMLEGPCLTEKRDLR